MKSLKKKKNNHFQGFFTVDEKILTYQQVKNKFRDFKDFRGYRLGSDRSCVSMKKDTYKAYTLKDGDVRIVKNFTDEQIKEIPEWEEQQEQKIKETFREIYSREFYKFCTDDEKVDMQKYCLKWVASKYIDFAGTKQRPEMLSWIKGMIFNTQCRLIYGCNSDNRRYQDAKSALIARLLD